MRRSSQAAETAGDRDARIAQLEAELRQRDSALACRLMGGDLTVESVDGQGSTFTVMLPTVVAQPVA